MKAIAERSSCELDIKKSRFLAEAFPVATQEEARALLKAQKERYADANHVVHAFVIGPTGGILGSSDDGEPSGTAGLPVLDVLKGTGLTGIMITVTRWFGGTLLGTGGLVKAYGESAKAVLALALPAAREIIAMREFSVSLPYDLYERLKRELSSFDVELSLEEFGVDVRLAGSLPESRADDFCVRVSDLSSARSRVALSEQNPMARKP